MTISNREPISVLIAEDHDMTRSILKLALMQHPGINVIDEAADGKAAIDKTLQSHPAIILMDIGLPIIDGIQATRIIKKNQLNSNTRIIMLTTHDRDTDVFAALGADADGYCLKETADQQLVVAIRAVHSGKAYLDPAIARIVLQAALANGNLQRDSAEPLSKIETQVLNQVANEGEAYQSGICKVDTHFLQKLHRFQPAQAS